MKLEFANPPSPESTRLLLDNVRAFNQVKTGNELPRTIGYFIKDDEGRIIGGVQGMVWGRSMHIDVLWVDEHHRGEGLGSKLMTEVEHYAAEHGYPLVYLETASFQALPFYESLGYEKFGQLPEVTAGHALFFLRKELSSSN